MGKSTPAKQSWLLHGPPLQVPLRGSEWEAKKALRQKMGSLCLGLTPSSSSCLGGTSWGRYSGAFPSPSQEAGGNLPGQHLEWGNCPPNPAVCVCACACVCVYTHTRGSTFATPSSHFLKTKASCQHLAHICLLHLSPLFQPMLPRSPSFSGGYRAGLGAQDLRSLYSPLPWLRSQGRKGRGLPHPRGAPGSWQSQLEPLEAAANDSSPTAPTPPPQTHPGAGKQAPSPR